MIKANLLQALHSIRSEAQWVERIDHDLLFRWFLDLRIDKPVFDATVSSHNRGRLERHDLIGEFFNHTVRRAVATGLVSPDHFSADGSLIERTYRIMAVTPANYGPRDKVSATPSGSLSRYTSRELDGERDFSNLNHCPRVGIVLTPALSPRNIVCWDQTDT